MSDRITLSGLSATRMGDRGEQAGRGYWRIRGPSPARETWWSGWATPAEVQVELAALVADPSRRKRPGRTDLVGPCRTVGDLLDRWLRAQERRYNSGEIAAGTWKNYRAHVRYWLATPVAELSARRLTRAHVADQVTAWLGQGIAPRTVDVAVESLTVAVGWGAERELCPAVSVSVPRSARRDEHVYCDHTPSRWEVDLVIKAIQPCGSRDAIELLALTGARVGEVAAARVADVDLRGRGFRLHGASGATRGKTGVRTIPARGALLALLARLVDGRQPGERLVDVGARAISKAIRGGCSRAGVPQFTPHGLRRLVVGELLEHGDARHVASWTGHSVATMLEAYVRPTQGTLEALAARAGLGDDPEDKVIPMPGTDSGHRSRG